MATLGGAWIIKSERAGSSPLWSSRRRSPLGDCAGCERPGKMQNAMVRGARIHRSTTEKYSARFFNYLNGWVRVSV